MVKAGKAVPNDSFGALPIIVLRGEDLAVPRLMTDNERRTQSILKKNEGNFNSEITGFRGLPDGPDGARD